MKPIPQDVLDIQESIDATRDTILGLERAIAEKEAELRMARRAHEVR